VYLIDAEGLDDESCHLHSPPRLLTSTAHDMMTSTSAAQWPDLADPAAAASPCDMSPSRTSVRTTSGRSPPGHQSQEQSRRSGGTGQDPATQQQQVQAQAAVSVAAAAAMRAISKLGRFLGVKAQSKSRSSDGRVSSGGGAGEGSISAPFVKHNSGPIGGSSRSGLLGALLSPGRGQLKSRGSHTSPGQGTRQGGDLFSRPSSPPSSGSGGSPWYSALSPRGAREQGKQDGVGDTGGHLNGQGGQQVAGRAMSALLPRMQPHPALMNGATTANAGATGAAGTHDRPSDGVRALAATYAVRAAAAAAAGVMSDGSASPGAGHDASLHESEPTQSSSPPVAPGGHPQCSQDGRGSGASTQATIPSIPEEPVGAEGGAGPGEAAHLADAGPLIPLIPLPPVPVPGKQHTALTLPHLHTHLVPPPLEASFSGAVSPRPPATQAILEAGASRSSSHHQEGGTKGPSLSGASDAQRSSSSPSIAPSVAGSLLTPLRSAVFDQHVPSSPGGPDAAPVVWSEQHQQQGLQNMSGLQLKQSNSFSGFRNTQDGGALPGSLHLLQPTNPSHSLVYHPAHHHHPHQQQQVPPVPVPGFPLWLPRSPSPAPAPALGQSSGTLPTLGWSGKLSSTLGSLDLNPEGPHTTHHTPALHSHSRLSCQLSVPRQSVVPSPPPQVNAGKLWMPGSRLSSFAAASHSPIVMLTTMSPAGRPSPVIVVLPDY
jgi:hypothetical protein